MLLHSLLTRQREIIIGAMEKRCFTSGDVIIRQGDPGDFYYILASGSCDIFKNGELVLQVCVDGVVCYTAVPPACC